ncbi:hypothetical protein RQP46_003017 [Phenoliferia psychrophenolica]
MSTEPETPLLAPNDLPRTSNSLSPDQLYLALSFSLLLFPLLLAFALPILRAISSGATSKRVAKPALALASLGALGFAGVCGLAGLAGAGESAATIGGVLLLLAQLALDLHLLLIGALPLLDNSPVCKPAAVILTASLMLATVLHLVLVATPTNGARSMVVPALQTAAHILFDIGLSAVFTTDVRRSLVELSSLPHNVTRERLSPPPRSGDPAVQHDKERSHRFSNPWRPASVDPPASPGSSTPHSLLSTLLLLRSFRMLIVQSLSIALYITAVALPISYDYSTFTTSGRIMPTVFGTTTSPGGFVALTIVALLRWSGVGLDLFLPNGPANQSPPPSPNLRSFALRTQTSQTSDHESQQSPTSPSPSHSTLPSRTNTNASRHNVRSSDGNRKSSRTSMVVPASRQRHHSLRSSTSSQLLSPPSGSLGLPLPHRIDTPPNSGVFGEEGLGITFPPGAGSLTTFSGFSSGSRRSRPRPAIAALHLSLTELPSPSFSSPPFPSSSYTPPTPRTPLRRGRSTEASSPVDRAPIDLDVEGGDPFARAPSTDALAEFWKRRDEGDLTHLSLSGSLVQALEAVSERDAAGNSTGSEDGESIIYHDMSRAESSALSDDTRDERLKTPSPPSMKITAATPSDAGADDSAASIASTKDSPLPAPRAFSSNIQDPFPAPAFSNHTLSSPAAFLPLNLPHPRSASPQAVPSRPPLRPYSSAPPNTPSSPTPSRSSFAPSSPGSLWNAAPNVSQFALRRVLRGASRRRAASRDSVHSDESFACAGEPRDSISSFAAGAVGATGRGIESEDDIERLESEGPAGRHRDRSGSDSDSPPGLKQLQLPQLVSSQEERSSPSYRRAKRSWWKSGSLSSSTSSRPPTPSSPSPAPWSGLAIRHSSSFPALSDLRRSDGLPASLQSDFDWSGGRSDTRQSAPATGRRGRLFGSTSPDGTRSTKSRTSTPKPASGRRDSESGSGSSHPHDSSDSNNIPSQQHAYRQVQRSSITSSFRRASSSRASRIPRRSPSSDVDTDGGAPEASTSGADVTTFDNILNWELPLFPDATEADDATHAYANANDFTHFGFAHRRPGTHSRELNSSTASSTPSFFGGGGGSLSGSDRPLVSHHRTSTIDESPPPSPSHRERTASHTRRRWSLDETTTRTFARDALATLDSPTTSSSAGPSSSSPRSDLGWTTSPASDSTGFMDSPAPRSPLSGSGWGFRGVRRAK